ncbi:MAG TPA: hypothetical protein VFG14_04690 [Chthoniobacteraceae bacterium]|nr:hypothetical protein [Chthoniobacteraceae bacterium]
MALADPLDDAVARAFTRTTALRERVARVIYAFDQEAIERTWGQLSGVGRQTYYDIAEAVIAEVRR